MRDRVKGTSAERSHRIAPKEPHPPLKTSHLCPCARLILQQESEAARGGVQLLVHASLKNSKDTLRIQALNPITLQSFSLLLHDDLRHLPLPRATPGSYNDMLDPREDAALTRLCSRLRLINLGQVRPKGEDWD